MFQAAVAEARQTHWFAEGAVPDTVEGRFSVLATIVALLIVRLEQAGESGEAGSVLLTERFVEAMDAEVRQMGVGDPSISKQVRSLVGALAARVERWRQAAEDETHWPGAVLRSVYRDQAPPEGALRHSEDRLKCFWDGLEGKAPEQIIEGDLH